MDERKENQLKDPLDEAGNIGDEQNPAYIEKTDKQDWNQSASKAKKKSLIDRFQELEEGE